MSGETEKAHRIEAKVLIQLIPPETHVGGISRDRIADAPNNY